MKIPAVVVFISVLFPSFLFGQISNQFKIQSDSKIVTVRVIELLVGGSNRDKKVICSDGNKILFEVEMEVSKSKNLGSNLNIVTSALNGVTNSGFRLISSNAGGGSDWGFLFTYFVFEKEN